MIFNLTITFSKIMALLMLAVAAWISFHLEDVTPYTVGLPVIAGLLANKQYQDRVLGCKKSVK